MKVLFLDVETTGLDPVTCDITEIGYAIFETDDYTKPYVARSFLIEREGEITDEITQLTGITEKHLYHGDDLGRTLLRLLDDLKNFKVEYMVAHNGQFDMDFLQAAFLKSDIPIPVLTLIDSVKDVPYPPEISTRTLRFLATEHGFMNPFPHSAIFDVFCMAKVVSHYSWEDILAYKNEPEVTVKANTTFQTKELAKKARFSWDGEKKGWFKTLKKRELPTQSAAWEFTFEVV